LGKGNNPPLTLSEDYHKSIQKTSDDLHLDTNDGKKSIISLKHIK